MRSQDVRTTEVEMLHIASSKGSMGDTKIGKMGDRETGKPVHGRALCWAARIVSLIPGIAYASIATAIRAAEHGSGGEIFQTAAGCFAILVLPGLIAWRRHLAGSVLLAGYALVIVFVGFTSEVAFTSEIDSHGLLWILPLGLALFAGAFINLMVWVWETEGNRGPRQT